MLSSLRAALDDVGRVLIIADAPAACSRTSRRHSFPDTDAALEWCEDRILERLGHAGAESAARDLADPGAAAGAHAERARRGRATWSIVLEVPAGEVVFREGDHADAIYFVLVGPRERAPPARSAAVATGGSRRSGPGVAVGEMAFLDEGRRSADVVAERRLGARRASSIDDLHAARGAARPASPPRSRRTSPATSPGRLRRANEQVRMLAALTSGGRVGCTTVVGRRRRRTIRGRRRRARGSASSGTFTCTESARSATPDRRREPRRRAGSGRAGTRAAVTSPVTAASVRRARGATNRAAPRAGRRRRRGSRSSRGSGRRTRWPGGARPRSACRPARCALVHHDEPVGEGERLVVVVGHEQGGEPEAHEERAELGDQPLAQRRGRARRAARRA